MISYVTGPLGAGKSAYAARKIARALLSGRVAAANVRLVDGWEHRLLKHAHYYKLAGRRARSEYRAEVAGRYFYSPDLRTLVNLRLHGKGENRGVRVLDEAHNALNNRDYAEKEQKAQLRKMTLSRKRGWDDYVIAQNKDNTDVALRRVSSVEIRLLDWQQVTRVPFIGAKLLPFHFFLAQGFLQNVASTAVNTQRPLFREVFFLGWWAKLYDTHEDFDVDDQDDEPAIWLPRTAGTPQAGGRARETIGGAVVLHPRRSSYRVKDGEARSS